MDLFEQTRQFHQNGDYQQALSGYQTMLEEEPDNPQLCYLLALLYFEKGDVNNASDWFRRTVSLAPEAAPAHYNLGVIFYEQEQYAEAAKAYKEAAGLCPEDADIFFNLGLTWKKMGEYTKALSCYEKVLSLTPDDADALYNIGVLYKDMGQPVASIKAFEQVLKNNPDHAQALNNLGFLYHKEGESKKAIATYKKLIALDHNATMAAHMLAALTGETTATAPDAYVRDVFDNFSDHYDESLVEKLGYTTPSRLRRMLPDEGSHRFENVLDLGCGTGLSGQAFHDLADQLTGLDLSSKMLELAGKKEIYNRLYETDICSFLKESQEKYDLFLSADVFVYIGDLSEIFRLIKEKSSADALFLFSTELARSNFTLKPTGRYGHAELYIQELAQEHGFKVLETKEANIRMEKGEWITGNLYMLQA